MLTGRCECARVKYRVEGSIHDFSHCHCSQCRRLHGAAFASFGGVAKSDFSYLSGESDLASYASSDSHSRLLQPLRLEYLGRSDRRTRRSLPSHGYCGWRSGMPAGVSYFCWLESCLAQI